MSSPTRIDVRSSILTLIALAAVAAVWMPATASADFGIEPGSVSTSAEEEDGSLDLRASSHPFSYIVHFNVNTDEEGLSEGVMRDILIEAPSGLIGNPQAVPACTREIFEGGAQGCSSSTQIGVLDAELPGVGRVVTPIYNLVPPPGVAAQFGVNAKSAGLLSLQNAGLRTENPQGAPEYGVSVFAPNIPVVLNSITATIWGTPADPGHTPQRGPDSSGGGFPSEAPLLAFLTLPAQCSTPLGITVKIDSIQNPGVYSSESAVMESAGNPATLAGCGSVPFDPSIGAAPSTNQATSGSGLEFELGLPDQGLLAPGAIAETEPRKTVVTLPEGMTVNPSFAEGTGVCSSAQYAAEELKTAPGAGCPEASKLGSIVAKTPLLGEAVEGAVYLAAPYENQFGTLAAAYLVARAPERGILVKQAGKIEFDQNTGQITTSFDGLPPVPFGSFELHFREGTRAPLVTPPACGEYRTNARLTPFLAQSDAEALERTSAFQIKQGVSGGPCPSGGTPPFHPDLTAGTINNAAGAYSPFNLRLTRTDSEQEITHFSIKLPPGVTGKLAGIPFCSDAQIAAAKSRERQPHGGQEELNSPSCPAASEVGHTLVGAGVGSSLTYVPGKVYLAGPYHGDSLSIVAITAAKAGPFDLGTVVIREGLEVNPETAEVFVDATGSDPIPHIVNGIPVHLRDVRVYVDRPNFVLNPTNCEPTSTASTVLGSGTNFASEADDRPVTVTTRYQAADCASLGYQPRVQLKLKGSTKRSGNPALTAILRPRAGDANSRKISVALPHSEFLDQSHIGTICTRVQFKAGGGNGEQCPAASVYGKAKVWTPLLSEPLVGTVFLRSSEHPLPDLVLALHGLINFDAVGRIDSVNGGIRTTFETVPDAPIEKVELSLAGGKKGLLENSTNICIGSHKANTEYTGQNGKKYSAQVPLQASCGKKKSKKKARAAAKKRPSLQRLIAW